MSDYSDHPRSISEVRGEREGTPEAWKPRDVLIKMLRDIDSGEMNPDHLILATASFTEEGETYFHYMQAGTFNSYAQVGMISHLMHEFNNNV